MSPGITVSLHWWRGWGRDTQRDLFWWHLRLGFLTISLDRTDTLTAYRKLRVSIERAVERADMEIR